MTQREQFIQAIMIGLVVLDDDGSAYGPWAFRLSKAEVDALLVRPEKARRAR